MKSNYCTSLLYTTLLIIESCIISNNPCQGKVNVRLLDALGNTLKLLDTSSIEKGDDSYQLDFSDLPSGIYLLKFDFSAEKFSGSKTIKLFSSE